MNQFMGPKKTRQALGIKSARSTFSKPSAPNCKIIIPSHSKRKISKQHKRRYSQDYPFPKERIKNQIASLNNSIFLQIQRKWWSNLISFTSHSQTKTNWSLHQLRCKKLLFFYQNLWNCIKILKTSKRGSGFSKMLRLTPFPMFDPAYNFSSTMLDHEIVRIYTSTISPTWKSYLAK